MLKALLILLKACDIFSIFAVWDAVEREVLIDLGFVKAVVWNGGEAGSMVKCA